MKNLARLFPAVLIVITVWLATLNHVAIADWWTLRNYEPPAKIEEIASNMNLSEKGTKYFYVSEPQLNDKTEFNENCPSAETSSVLGCYTSGRKIFILDVKLKELEGVEDVTAVHEMLHAAYDRLSNEEKSKVNKMLNETFKELNNPRLQEVISEYQGEGTAVVINELHSRLATEVETLPEELEEYYSQYFTDGRKATLETFKDYESVFEDIKERKETLLNQINNLKSEISLLKSKINSTRSQLDSIRSRMDQYERQGRTDEYNALVPIHNNLVGQLRNTVSRHNSLVNSLNSKISEYNSLTFRQQELIEAIDSGDIDTPESL